MSYRLRKASAYIKMQRPFSEEEYIWDKAFTTVGKTVEAGIGAYSKYDTQQRDHAFQKQMSALRELRDRQQQRHDLTIQGLKEGSTLLQNTLDKFDSSFDRRHKERMEQFRARHLERMQQDKAEQESRLESLRFQQKLLEQREQQHHERREAAALAASLERESEAMRRSERRKDNLDREERAAARRLGWARLGREYLNSLLRIGDKGLASTGLHTESVADIERSILKPVVEPYQRLRVSATVSPIANDVWDVDASMDGGTARQETPLESTARAFVFTQAAGSNATFANISLLQEMLKASHGTWLSFVKVERRDRFGWFVRVRDTVDGVLMTEPTSSASTFVAEATAFEYLHTILSEMQSHVFPILCATETHVEGSLLRRTLNATEFNATSEYNVKMYRLSRDARVAGALTPAMALHVLLGLWACAHYGIVHGNIEGNDVLWVDQRADAAPTIYLVSPTEFVVLPMKQFPQVLHWGGAREAETAFERRIDFDALARRCKGMQMQWRDSWSGTVVAFCQAHTMQVHNIASTFPREYLPGTAGWEQRVYVPPEYNKQAMAAAIAKIYHVESTAGQLSRASSR